MRDLSKIVTSAIALTMAFTIAAPITANAEVRISRTDTGQKSADGNPIYSFEVKNEDTGKGDTIVSDDDKDTLEVSKTYESEKKAITVGTKVYETLDLFTTKDVRTLSGFKTNKKDLKFKVTHKDEYSAPELMLPSYDYENNGKYYYRNVNGDVIALDNEDDFIVDASFATYTIRFYAKKAGSYKFTYTANLKNGTTLKKSIKVIARDDAAPFKSVTFAGKSIIENSYTGQRTELLEKGSFENRTHKKSGVLSVKMNKGFKLKKIEVGKLKYRKIDINDPDWKAEIFDPVFDRFDDKYEWKKINNNKKLKLNKQDQDSFENVDIESKELNMAIHSSNKGTWACTPVRITYYDKADKTTHRKIIEIHKLINK